MPLTFNRYGKARVRTLRLARDTDRHEVSELTFSVMLEGGFGASFTEGDNRASIATDTIKNIVNVLSHQHPREETERFAQRITRFFLDRYPQVEQVDVTAVETRWQRIAIDGTPHRHGFVLDGNGQPLAHVLARRDGALLESGLQNFTFMKTTESGWSDFHADEFRTLPDTQDRILATSMDATWTWDELPEDCRAANARLLDAMMKVFLAGFSPSVQNSLYLMGEAALAAVPEISRIRLAMPNKHYIPINLTPFGIAETGTVFLPTDEPHGQIEAVISRA